MARRYIADPQISRLALWARRLALFALPVALLAVIIERAGLLEIIPVLATFGAALALAVLAILVAIIALIRIWFDGRQGTRNAVIAIFVSLLLLAYPGYLGMKAYRLPMIYDITTDPYDPPRFEAVARLRTREANPVAYAGLATYQQQRVAYPDIDALIVPGATPQAAYDAALGVVTKRKWRVVDARAPQAGRRDGLIEAIALSPIMGFRDDVAIRIRAVGTGARVDVRSASRYGWHDFGTNAARVASLMEDIDDAATPDKIEQPLRKAQKPTKPAVKESQATRR
ncbi:MAG: DUF1499 domain-containing protein [Xanthobacteraceae bacterium]